MKYCLHLHPTTLKNTTPTAQDSVKLGHTKKPRNIHRRSLRADNTFSKA